MMLSEAYPRPSTYGVLCGERLHETGSIEQISISQIGPACPFL